MPTCTFFGHRDCPDSIRPALQEAVLRLIDEEGVDRFYVGHQGKFDRLALAVLQQTAAEHPHIGYQVVLAYLPAQQDGSAALSPANSLLPEGIESVPKRFAISYRNRWMVAHADYVIAYVRHRGCADQFAELARRKGKQVICL